MKKFKLISETGTDRFQAALSEWIYENSNKEIISVSHSTVQLDIQISSTQSMKGLEYSALILYVD